MHHDFYYLLLLLFMSMSMCWLEASPLAFFFFLLLLLTNHSSKLVWFNFVSVSTCSWCVCVRLVCVCVIQTISICPRKHSGSQARKPNSSQGKYYFFMATTRKNTHNLKCLRASWDLFQTAMTRKTTRHKQVTVDTTKWSQPWFHITTMRRSWCMSLFPPQTRKKRSIRKRFFCKVHP